MIAEQLIILHFGSIAVLHYVGVVRSKFVFDEIIHVLFAVLALDELLAELECPIKLSLVHQDVFRQWVILDEVPAQVALVFLVVVGTNAVVSFRLKVHEFIIGLFNLVFA